MPQQQQPPQFDFNPGATQGPFSGMLTGQQPTMGQQQQPTGWTTKTGSVLNVVTNFLSGMEKGRVKNYERQEQQQAKERGVVMDYINMKLRDPNLTDEGRAALEKQGMQYMAKSVLGATEGKGKKKDGDQPQGIMGHVAGAFHDIALGMVGGQMPKKGDKQDPAAIMAGIDDIAKSPQFSKAAAIENAQKQVQQILQQVPQGADQQAVLRALQGPLAVLQKYMPAADFANYKDTLLGGYQAPMAPGVNPQHQFINLVPPEGSGKPMISARVGPDGKLYGLDQKEIPGSTLQGYTMQVPGTQTKPVQPKIEQLFPKDGRGEPISAELHGDGKYYKPGTNEQIDASQYQVRGQNFQPGTNVVEENGKRVIETKTGSVGKTAPPPTARTEDPVARHEKAFAPIRAWVATQKEGIEKDFSRWQQIITNKSAADAQQAGMPAGDWTKAAQWAIDERKRRYAELQKIIDERVRETNESLYPVMRNDAPPALRSGQGNSTQPAGNAAARPAPVTSKEYANWATGINWETGVQ